MLIGFNWIDFGVTLFVVIYAAFVFKRGFLAQFFEFLGFTISLVSAISLFPLLSLVLFFIGFKSELVNLISFIFIFIFSEVLFSAFFNDFFRKLPMTLILSRFNRYFGLIPNLFSSFLIVSFISTVIVVLPIPTNVKTALTSSKIVGNLLPFTTSFNAPLERAFTRSISEGIISITSTKQDSASFVRLSIPNNKAILDSDSEKQLFIAVNQTRIEKNLPLLQSNLLLTKIARDHSKAMIDEGYFGHIDPKGRSPYDRALAENLVFNSLAENLSFAPDSITAHEGFLHSKEHLKAMISTKYTRVGIGVYDTVKYGKMFTEMFAD